MYRRKLHKDFCKMVDEYRFEHGDDGSDHLVVALIEVTGADDICTRCPSLARQVEEFMMQYQFFTYEVDRIVTFLDTLMAWHDELLAERLRNQGFKIEKESLTEFGEMSDRLRDHIKSVI
jgi:hypothetical protein